MGLLAGQAPVERTLPVGAVLTISAAGSETSSSAVLTRDDTLEKRGLTSEQIRPRFAVMDPELTCSLPPYQIACGVVDIMMHTLDRYFTCVTGNLLTDEIAQGLLRTVIRCGARALADPCDLQTMSELMWAGSLSHNGLTGLGAPKDFAVHQLGHELSAPLRLRPWGHPLRCMGQLGGVLRGDRSRPLCPVRGERLGSGPRRRRPRRSWPGRPLPAPWTTSAPWGCPPA